MCTSARLPRSLWSVRVHALIPLVAWSLLRWISVSARRESEREREGVDVQRHSLGLCSDSFLYEDVDQPTTLSSSSSPLVRE